VGCLESLRKEDGESLLCTNRRISTFAGNKACGNSNLPAECAIHLAAVRRRSYISAHLGKGDYESSLNKTPTIGHYSF
jgi:hypothetical protein